MLTLDTCGLFTWSFGHLFHIETPIGNFEWSDPDYDGDNTIKPCLPYEEWIKRLRIPFGRDKGFHKIRNYCGEEVKIVS